MRGLVHEAVEREGTRAEREDEDGDEQEPERIGPEERLEVLEDAEERRAVGRQVRDELVAAHIGRADQYEVMTPGVDLAFRRLFEANGLPADLRIVAFPDFARPGAAVDVPHVTEACMTRYHTERTRREFMCAYSKMVVKQGGRMRVYACTLVDDDPAYDQGGSLHEALGRRVLLRHQRCYSCFAYGASCSETAGA